MFAVSKNNPHRGGILTCAHMLPPSSQRKSSQKRDFELGLHASHHLKNNPPKGRIPKRWDKNLVQEILPEGRIINRVLLIEGYLHVSTFYSERQSGCGWGQRRLEVGREVEGRSYHDRADPVKLGNKGPPEHGGWALPIQCSWIRLFSSAIKSFTRFYCQFSS